MLPRAVPPYPGPLSMTPEQHYELVEAQALITEEGDRILFEEDITLNVDFGTRVEERHFEGCVCVVCKEVERGMGGRTSVTGGVEGECAECVCADEERDGDDDDDDNDDDNDHDGESLFIGTGEMSQVKISKPLSPELHRMRRRKQAGSSTASISTVSSMSTTHADEWKKRNASLEHDDEYQVSEMDSSDETENNSSGVTTAYSHAPVPSSSSGDDVLRERGMTAGQEEELHATWNSQVKDKKCWSNKVGGGVARSLSKRSLSIGRSRDKERGRGSDGSAGSRTGKVWHFARSLSRRSDNSGHSSRTIQPAKDDHTMLGAQMDGSGYQDHYSSFEEEENPNMSFQGDEDIMEPRDGARPFIGPRRNPEIHDFPRFDPAQFTPSKSARVASDSVRRRSGSESDVSTLGPHAARSRSRSRSPSLRSRHYSSRGSFSLNWDNISSDTVYHKHARRFYQNPAAYGAEIPGYNPETDDPYLAYDRYREVSEWADSTEEADPDHVVALTTRELKRLCGAEIRIPFDFIPEGYVNPPASKAGSVVGDDEDAVTTMEMEEDDEERGPGPQPSHKNLVDLLGMPGWAHEWEDMTKMQRHFHIVAAGDWRMGPVFDVKSNYSDYFGVPLFELNDVGLDGVNRREVRGLEIPDLKELELRFRLEGCEGEDGGCEERDQRRCSDEDVKAGSPTEYDSDGFLYDDDKQGEVTGNFDPTESTGSEADRFSRRPSDVSLSNRSGDGSDGDYAGSIVEGYGITDDRRTGANINPRIDDTFRGRMARGYTLNSRFGQDTFAPSNADSVISEEPYDTDDDEDYESDDGVSANYSFGNSSYHGTECQEDYAIGTSKFAPHAFQLYPPYEAANDCTTIGIAPSEIQNTRPSSWDADFMEDILGYSVHEENRKPHDPTAEMVIMSYLDPVPQSRRSSIGAKSRSRSSSGSLTPVPSPTKSTRTTRSFVPSVKSLSRSFARNRPLPPTPEDASCKTFSKYELKSVSSLRKPSLSTANIAKLNKHKEKSSLPKPTHPQNPTSKSKSIRSKTTLSKISTKSKPKHKPILRLKPRKSKNPAPPRSTSSSDSNTSYVDLTRCGSAYAVPPAQSLILYLHGRGLGADHIAFLMQSLDEKFLYDSNSNWWPLDPLSSVSASAVAPIRYLHSKITTLPNVPLCADSSPTPPPPQTNIAPIRFPPHTLFTPTTVSQILQRCRREAEWWEPADARDPDGKILPPSFRLLKKGMRVRKARGLVRKTVENFLWWRIGGGVGVGVPHGNLMRG
ncbi:hypothetical protein BCIN_04g05380 [Botrytis cinerea B05.10]|uniref:Uncharacterized protein n=1 Tax=Botryotinia fuckeliana (strain B05.10) TaxID=332648 RepID=A0A384JFJ8_BOTFB|nr:hypothetical protein BCIN_04g05380 [Botrytis cinerea B05.10]XP_024548446.1 hypothetical protein BCIN_04g05380 [Botrytis cinerea B05.10]ATZ49382.1 hypothetical protein BCIN_04g05380 [Botrytis cinerea B05.10]ATZ49383.1 hypothetical protein BCIN_04g05380 [Botrytis cinerea B05.10]